MAAIIVTVANDIGALVFGKLFGRHPMARAISPNKTWEGAIGAAVLTVIAGACVSLAARLDASRRASRSASRAAVLAPLGDLCESMFKRSLGLKDMGRTLPGHGGLLDRVDGLLVRAARRRTTSSSRITWADGGREARTVAPSLAILGATGSSGPRRSTSSRGTPAPSSSTR